VLCPFGALKQAIDAAYALTGSTESLSLAAKSSR
jgi:hypothetical protein